MHFLEIIARTIIALSFLIVELYKKKNNKAFEGEYKLDKNLFKTKRFMDFYTAVSRIFYIVMAVQVFVPETVGFIYLPSFVNITFKVIGLLLVISGFVSYLWARESLGKYWTPPVCILNNHSVINKGPYLYERHPIYVSYILMVFASQLYFTSWFVIFALIYFVGYRLLVVEEGYMTQELGKNYIKYKKETKTLLFIK